MLTDAPPLRANRSAFLESDRLGSLDTPKGGRLLITAKSIEQAMQAEGVSDLRQAVPLGEQHLSVCSGCLWLVGVGGSIGPRLIGKAEQSFPLLPNAPLCYE